MNPRRLDSRPIDIDSLRQSVLLTKNQRSKVFRHMVGIAVDDTGRLPAHEVTLRILAEPVYAIQVSAPFRAGLYRMFADSLERHTRRRVPDMVRFINPAQSLPAGIPVGLVFVMSQVDCQVDPIACRRNLELTVALDVGPIVSQKEFDHVPVPQLEAIFSVVR